MKKSVISTLICCTCLRQLVVLSVQGEISTSVGKVHHQRERITQHPKLTGQKVAMETQKRVMKADKSGLKGTTSSIVRSGIPGGQTTGGLRSVEFAIAPIEGENPAYHKAIFVKSDQQGNYEVALPPGKYWMGPKAKALNPVNYRPGAIVLSEEVAVVKEGEFTQIDLIEVGYAP
jgi:hypothetical protein